MTDTRIATVIVDAQDVAKPDLRDFVEGSLPNIFSDADAVRAEDLSSLFLISILSLNGFFKKDTQSTDPDNGTSIIADSAGNRWLLVGGGGDVVGPASSTAGNLPTFADAGGKTLQDSGVGISNVVTSVGGLTGAVNLISQRIITAAGDVTMLASDNVILLNKTVGAATTVNLLTAAGRTRPVIIKDLKGDAATNTITIDPNAAETVDSLATYEITFNGGSLALYPLADGSGWFIL